MSSIQFIVHPLPGTEDQLNDRLKEVAEKLNRFGFTVPQSLSAIRAPVKEIVVGPTHIGILFEDGEVCRVPFSIIPDRLDLTRQDPTKKSRSWFLSNSSGPSGGGGGGAGGGSGGGGGGSGSGGGNGVGGSSQTGGGSSGPTGSSGAAGNKSSSGGVAPPSGRQLARSRARIMRSNTAVRGSSNSQGSRSASGVIIGAGGGSGGARSIVSVPAPYVPEELVSQAQVVLQGKSRNLIIRELQRTNLDVNLAVNNLLSRDDEEGEEAEDGGDSYVPEDLISLLDGGFHADHSVIIDADAMFSEDMFGYSSIRK